MAAQAFSGRTLATPKKRRKSDDATYQWRIQPLHHGRPVSGSLGTSKVSKSLRTETKELRPGGQLHQYRT